MHILVSGLSHKTAPVEIREAMTFPDHALGEALVSLTAYPHINEAVILSTCNRTEVYAVASDIEAGQEDIAKFLNSCHEEKNRDIDDYLYRHDSLGAINHLFRVVSSLDSMVVGEAQILGQTKDAYGHAFDVQTTNLVFNKLFRQAFGVGKRVRTETDIGENAVSISYAAVQLAKKVFNNLAGKSVMLVGAGEMSELTAKHLLSNGVEDVLITNRSHDKAVEMAKTFRGRAVKFESFVDEMAEADIVITSTGAPHTVISKADMKKVMAKRRGHPIFLIDIAVPRDIDADVNDVENAYLYDIDDLQSVVDSNIEERTREAKEAETIIKQEVQEFLAWLSALEVIPTIADLRRTAERIRQAELDRVGGKLAELSAEELNAVNAITSGIINKLLHEPMIRLKQSAGQKEGYLYVDSLRHLFALDQEDETPKKKKSTGEMKNISPVKNEYGTGR